ncbi:hypothetical protein G9G63_08995 [Paenibacillus sp. EKM202P]|uniref:hypothetical protein n=1 Tax=unclassified Paenibacillus TaxID=185978 RepID=UPI0013ED6820|nr:MULTISPECIES: hypothetical protein [unclassified Paenibacillus]KAF6565286.1 hypothetical protein G9G63_08995 [Paenibacillus sp. EKM202P]KAF6569388.1 hypothetical protein G9G64_13095 [Paenibacillus sp. EKM207P]
MNELELLLLKMWEDCGIEQIYKYKNRINAYRESLPNRELFYDLTYQLFKDVEDIADYEHSSPEEYKVEVESLIKSRKEFAKQ